MRGGLELHQQRQLRPPDRGQQLEAGLDRAFRPAVLLRLEAIHIDRQFRRRDEIRQEYEPPALQLRAVAQVEVLRERIVLPATGIRDARTPPEARCTIEIEKPSATAAGGLFEQEVPV